MTTLKEDNNKCEDCIYYDPFDDAPGQGYCRRYPAQIDASITMDGENANWPIVDSPDWCGEYKGNAIIRTS